MKARTEDAPDVATSTPLLHLGDRFSRAIEYARILHIERRKGSDIPSMAHLLGVASLVMGEAGHSGVPVTEDMVIAAILHDAVEDHGGTPRLKDIDVQFWRKCGAHGRRTLRHAGRRFEPEGALGTAQGIVSRSPSPGTWRRPTHLRRGQAVQRADNPRGLPQNRPRGLEAFQAWPRPADLVLRDPGGNLQSIRIQSNCGGIGARGCRAGSHFGSRRRGGDEGGQGVTRGAPISACFTHPWGIITSIECERSFPHKTDLVVSVSRSFQRLVFVLSAGVFAVLGLGFGLGQFGFFGVHAGGEEDGAYRQMHVYAEVLKRIQSDYVTEPNIGNVTTGALHGLLESLDADSSYLTAAEYKIYKDRPATGVAQVGVTVSKRFGYATIVSVAPGSAADKEHLADGDVIESIGDQSTRELSLAVIRLMLEGKPGTIGFAFSGSSPQARPGQSLPHPDHRRIRRL